MTATGTGGRLRHGPGVARFAADVGPEGPVAVAGARTRWHSGGEPVREPRLVTAPVGIVEYKPDEMTIRIAVGTTVAELDAALAEHGQRSALPDRGGTVGGAVVVGENDRDVLSRGAVRNAVLQVSYVSSEGKVVSGGGPTVKNVSGFDIPRLTVGSLGTLGCLAEVILRTNPIPAVSRWFETRADPFALFDALLAPAALLWDGVTTWIHLEGHGPDVEAELVRASALGATAEVESPPQMPGPHRWSLPPAQLRGVGDLIDGRWLASIGVGTVLATTPQPGRELSASVTAVHDRMKQYFDPTGRLNPGRDPGRR